MGNGAKWLLLFFFAGRALGVPVAESVCRRVPASEAERPLTFFARPIPLQSYGDPFAPGVLKSLAELVRTETRHRGPASDLEQGLADRASFLAQKSFAQGAFAIDPMPGYQIRYDKNTHDFAIISNAGPSKGQVIFFYPLGPNNVAGFGSHLGLLGAAAKDAALRPGFGIPEESVSRLLPRSLESHFKKHAGEAGEEWHSPEAYENDAVAFAKSDNPRNLVIHKTDDTGEHLLKYDPVTNRFLVLTRQVKQLRAGEPVQWRITTFFRPNPAKHGKGSNIRFFLSLLAPGRLEL